MTPRFVLWTRARRKWLPVIESSCEASIRADEAACAADGQRVVVLPKGERPR